MDKELNRQKVLIYVWENCGTSKKRMTPDSITAALGIKKKAVVAILKQEGLFYHINKHNNALINKRLKFLR